MKNIEILVVSDGCTDDTEAIVRSYRDRRIRWIGLTENSGSQAIPNNIGIENARANYVAYLGHDDIWHPDHLASLFTVIQAAKADYAFSGAILYGPADTDVRMITGFPLRNNAQKIYHAIPPTTAMHTKALAEKLNGWRTHDEVVYGVDYDFQLRARVQGAIFVHTGKITAFKFPAAWDRDSYKKKDVSRQANLLWKMENEPDFMTNELLDVVKSAEHGFFIPTEAPKPLAKGAHFSFNTVMKGSRDPLCGINQPPKETLFTLDENLWGFEWYDLEKTESGLSFRWTGPRTESILFLTIATNGPIKLEIHILYTITPEVLDGLTIFVNDQPLEFIKKEDVGGWFLICDVSADLAKIGVKNKLKLKIKTPTTIAPIELDPNCAGKRRLGVAIHSVKCCSLT